MNIFFALAISLHLVHWQCFKDFIVIDDTNANEKQEIRYNNKSLCQQ